MSQPKEAFLRQAYTELAKAETSRDIERAFRTANRILKSYPHESAAFKCKIVSLIHLGKFEDVLQLLKKTAPSLTRGLSFEQAYCEYRLYRTEDAVKTLLDSCENDDSALDTAGTELMAQLYYRLERFGDAQRLYLKLMKNTSDDYEQERQTNLMAAHTQLCATGATTEKLNLSSESYEQHYNQACLLVTKHDFKRALTHLNKALESCRLVLTEDGVPDDEIEDEQALIRAQIAYCYQMQNKNDKAALEYQQILKIKPSDASAIAVASNNLISLRQEANLFDARKKLKTCQGTQVEQKLTKQQNRVVCVNNALLQLHSNQFDACRRALTELRDRFNDQTRAFMIEAALFCRQKDPSKAIELIEKYSKETEGLTEEESRQLELMLAHMHLCDGNLPATATQLESLHASIRFAPAVISVLVAIALSSKDTQQALDILTSATGKLKQQDVAADTDSSSNSSLLVILEQCALLYAKTGQTERASDVLEELRKLKPDDPKIVARLMRIYGDVDPAKAERLSQTLPSLMDKVGQSVDIELPEGTNLDVLESSESILYSKSKKQAKDTKDSPDKAIAKRRRRRKRQVRLPKNYDPNVPPDPERWLPRQERSTYKRRKDKRHKDRDITRGAQGAVSDAAAANLDQSSKPQHEASPSTNSPKPSPAPGPAGAGPRQQRPGASKAKAKAKKRW